MFFEYVWCEHASSGKRNKLVIWSTALTNKTPFFSFTDKTNQNPSFPADFTFSFTRLSSHQCTRLYEPRDRYWQYVYLCVKSGKKPVKIRWSYKGMIPQMACTRIYSNEKHYYLGWNDNYLCVPTKSPYKFRWSVNGPIADHECMPWRYTRDRRWGSSKYLCAKSDNKRKCLGTGAVMRKAFPRRVRLSVLKLVFYSIYEASSI